MINKNIKKESFYTRRAYQKGKKSVFSKFKNLFTLSWSVLKPVYTNKAPEPVGPYSQAMKIPGNQFSSRWIFLSGQIPLDPKTSQVVGDSISEQTEQVFENIQAILESQKINFNYVVKTLVFLTDMDDFEAFNQVYEKYFKEHQPARSCVEVSKLPKGVKVEVEVIACGG